MWLVTWHVVIGTRAMTYGWEGAAQIATDVIHVKYKDVN